MDEYRGKELDLFEEAENWKQYFASFIKPYLKGRILEVGAGIGGTTKVLCNGSQDKWLCLEPDYAQVLYINSRIEQHLLPDCCKAIQGTLQMHNDDKYNAILYIDVIEHIEKDIDELLAAHRLLERGGVLIILVPAHQWLYSPFDKAIGHFRRYNKTTLSSIVPESMIKKSLFYLDGFGVLASVANRLLLKQSYPTKKQIQFWNKYIVDISKTTDLLTRNLVGRSLLGIWQKQ